MYKRTEKAIANNPPPFETCVAHAQHGEAKYFTDCCFTICHVVDSSQAFFVIQRLRGQNRLKPCVVLGSLQAHAVINSVDDVCPALGTTDFGLPKVVYKND